MDEILKVSQLLVNIVSITIPICALLLYLVRRQKEKEKETYDYVENLFIDFQKLCIEDLETDIFDVTNEEIDKLDISKKELIAFSILISNFERAYIFYKVRQSKHDKGQWSGWVTTMCDYCERINFRIAWYINGFGWDIGFEKHMNTLIFSQLVEIFNEDYNEFIKEYNNYIATTEKEDSFMKYIMKFDHNLGVRLKERLETDYGV